MKDNQSLEYLQLTNFQKKKKQAYKIILAVY